MRHIRRPSPATILAFIAVLVALGGTAFAATGQIVNIGDASDPAKVAHVDAAGKLLVGDGTGQLTVDGTVNTQEALPANLLRLNAFLPGNDGQAPFCHTIASPPAGKAWILKSISIDVFQSRETWPDTPWPTFVAFYNSADCTIASAFDEAHVTKVGRSQLVFQPGVPVPNSGALSVSYNVPSTGSFDMYVNGIVVSAGSVPSSAALVRSEVRRAQAGPLVSAAR